MSHAALRSSAEAADTGQVSLRDPAWRCTVAGRPGEEGPQLEGTTAPEVRGQGREAGPPSGKAFPLYLFMSVGWRGGGGLT